MPHPAKHTSIFNDIKLYWSGVRISCLTLVFITGWMCSVKHVFQVVLAPEIMGHSQ